MTRDDLERGLDLLERRLGELRQVDADLVITWDARPDLPLCLVQVSGVELLIDVLGLIRRTDPQQPQPVQDDPAGAVP